MENEKKHATDTETAASGEELSSIGARGLVIHDGKEYYFVRESQWRAMPTTEPPNVKDAEDAILAFVPKLPQLFVNMDRIVSSSVKANGPDEAPQKVQPKGTAGIFIRANEQFYFAPAELWKKQRLQTDLARADAEVLVTRGAVAAVIPPNTVPVGAYCVLVNVTAIQRP
jgi:hypothetical protein